MYGILKDGKVLKTDPTRAGIEAHWIALGALGQKGLSIAEEVEGKTRNYWQMLFPFTDGGTTEYTSWGWLDQKGKKATHYGVWVDLTKPTTGVFENGDAEFISDECAQGIDLGWEEHLETCKKEDHDECDYEGCGDYLVGKWKRAGATKSWVPDETGEYAAIVREVYTQVVWSLWGIRGSFCSPCYPGQVDADTPGDILAYALPPDVIGEADLELKARIYKR